MMERPRIPPSDSRPVRPLRTQSRVWLAILTLVLLVAIPSLPGPSTHGQVRTSDSFPIVRAGDDTRLELQHSLPNAGAAATVRSGTLGRRTMLSASAGQWSELDEIPPRTNASMVNDSADGYLLVFGGYHDGSYLNQTWTGVEMPQAVYTQYQVSWTSVTPRVSPSGRDLGSMTYDWTAREVVLFGGFNGTSALGDTWIYSAGFWTEVRTPVHPSPRYAASMAYDGKDGYSVLFGGTNGTAVFNDTWAFYASNDTWRNITTVSAPSTRYGAAFSYDVQDAYAVLFGGSTGGGETWAFHGGNWALLHPTSPPPGRYFASEAYCVSFGEVVLAGGENPGPLNDVWVFNAGNWTKYTPSSSYVGPYMAASSGVYGDSGGAYFLWSPAAGASGPGESVVTESGGGTASVAVVTWPGSSPPARVGAGMAYDPTTGVTLMAGGVSAGGGNHFVDTWEFAGNGWTEQSANNFPGLAWGPMVYDAADGYFLSFGGYDSTPTLVNTTLDFTTTSGWQTLTVRTAPSPREDSAMQYDPAKGYVVLFGGTNTHYLNDTWTFSHGTWTNITSTAGVPPPARAAWNGMTYDPLCQCLILFGGGAPGLFNDTWSFANGTWTRIVTTFAPPQGQAGALAYDAADGQVLLVSGNGATGALDGMWAFSRDNWQTLSPSIPLIPRYWGGAVYDAADNEFVMMGGESSGGVSSFGDTWTYSLPAFNGSAAASLSQASVGQPVTFSSTAVNGVSPYNFTWSFGDGNTSYGANVTYAYSRPGSFAASVTILDNASHRLIRQLNVTVVSLGVTLSANLTRTDVGAPVAFAATGINGVSPYNFTWSFGDGSTGYGPNVTHPYLKQGTFPAHVTVTDTVGQQVGRWVNITVSPTLRALPTVNPDPTLVGQTVLFSANATGGTSPLNYSWEFGDSTPPTPIADPEHAYNATGNYSVQLVVTDGAGLRVVRTIALSVVAGPFSAAVAAAPTVGTTPLTVAFSVSLRGGTPPYATLWFFGDGSSSRLSNPTHTYNGTGTFEAKLLAADSQGTEITRFVNITVVGSSPLSVSATCAPATGDAPLPVSCTALAVGGAGGGYNYLWNFGDGTTGQGNNQSHVFAQPGIYVPTVTVSDGQGNLAEATLPAISVSTTTAPPSLTVHALATPSAGTPPVTVAFTSSVSGGVAPYNYTWHFDDGGTSAYPSPSHVFDAYGTYNVTLWVNDSSSPVQTALSSLTLLLSPSQGSTGLHLMMVASPVSGYAPLTTSFSVVASGGTGSYPYIAWSTGDGGFASGGTTSHTYLSRGIYHAQVTVTDSGGHTATASVVVTVLTPPMRLYAQASQYTGTAPLTITFNATASGGTQADYRYAWSFSDGGQATGETVEHRFQGGGTFAVTVTVTDSAGNTAATTLNVTLAPPPRVEPTLLGLPLLYAYALIGAVAAVLGIVLVVLYLRKREDAQRNRPKELPGWPESPLSILETSEKRGVLKMVAVAPISKENVLLLVKESPEIVQEEMGLHDMKIVQAAVSEGENKIKPGDLDRLGNLLEGHLRSGEGKVVVIEALDMVIDANQVKGARRLLDVVREVAQENKGKVLVQLNPSSLSVEERTRLEEGATILRY